MGFVFFFYAKARYTARFLKVNLYKIELLLEKEMAPHSSTLAWKIPWSEEPGRLQSMVSLRVKHN